MSDYNTVEVPRELLEDWYRELNYLKFSIQVEDADSSILAPIIARIEQLIPEYTEGEVAP